MNNGPINWGPLFVVTVTIGGGYLIWLSAHWSVQNIHPYSPWLFVALLIAGAWLIERAAAARSARSPDDE